jgi:two-component system cell cycle response regulator DivK
MNHDYLVLIVEDNAKNLKLARDLLQFKGFRTVEAVTAAEGLRLAAEAAPDLVLMDIQLPDMDGAAALARLRAAPATRGLCVVALTAFAMRDDQARLLAAGFEGYISKPIDVKQFPEWVRSYCERSRRGGSKNGIAHDPGR